MRYREIIVAAGVALLTACAGADPPTSGNQAPTAEITSPAEGTTVEIGEAVTFRGSSGDSDGTVISHAWNFGDGTSSAVAEPPPKSFATAGAFAVTYRVADSQGLESTPATRTLIVNGGAAPTNYAMRFYANDFNDAGRVKIRIDDPTNSLPGPPADIGATDFTIEFWMRGNLADNQKPAVSCGANIVWIDGNILLDRDRYSQDRKFGLSIAGGRVVFGLSGNGTGDLTICGTSNVLDGLWHHVAVTRARSNGALALFVDGALQASAASGPGGDVSYPDDGVPGNHCGGPCTRSDPYLVIGAEKHDVGPGYPGFSGEVDELRLSNSIRYTGAFTRPTTRFAPDAATAALYHFDEGAGSALVDALGTSSGQVLVGGTPPGPVWLTSTAPTGP